MVKKGQASLEYLIIIGAVIAVAAVVILFISNISSSGGQQTGFAACRTAASQCANAHATFGPDYDCTESCQSSCIAPASGKDLMSGETAADGACDNAASACGHCKVGEVSLITPVAPGG